MNNEPLKMTTTKPDSTVTEIEGVQDSEKSLEEIIQEVADEQGLTYEQTLKLFKKGLKQMGVGQKKTVTAKQKAKIKKKKKIAKESKKRNRK